MIKTLQNWKYDYCPNHLRFKLTGYCKERYEGHSLKNFIYTSTPVQFDKESMVVTTKSGSQYQLLDCAGNLEIELSNLISSIEDLNGN